MVAGTYAFMHYIGRKQATKDIDILCRPRDVKRALKVLSQLGHATELTHKHWLAKVYDSRFYADIIFRSSNRKLEITNDWFLHSQPARLLGQEVRVIPPEELIAQKMYVAGRDCFHGHDVYRLLHALSLNLDWRRLFKIMRADWQILYAHLMLFDFVFPKDSRNIPLWLIKELQRRETDRVKGSPRLKTEFRGDQLSLVDYASPRQLKALYNHPKKR